MAVRLMDAYLAHLIRRWLLSVDRFQRIADIAVELSLAKQTVRISTIIKQYIACSPSSIAEMHFHTQFKLVGRISYLTLPARNLSCCKPPICELHFFHSGPLHSFRPASGLEFAWILDDNL
eukprot:scaffold107408_cov16-Prasinocladus_malaysianus.AAC.2